MQLSMLDYIILEQKGYHITALACALSFSPGSNLVSMSAKLGLVPFLAILTVDPAWNSLNLRCATLLCLRFRVDSGLVELTKTPLLAHKTLVSHSNGNPIILSFYLEAAT